jgi:hypothetical protein
LPYLPIEVQGSNARILRGNPSPSEGEREKSCQVAGVVQVADFPATQSFNHEWPGAESQKPGGKAISMFKDKDL